MTVTLDPQLAGLLERTGHSWPDADEDRIFATAESWARLGARLDTVRADHHSAARSITTRNTGEAVAAFGDWASNLDTQLLHLVETCARAQAWLLSIARWIYDTKNAIINTLDDLARSIDQAERDLSGIPIIGGTLASALDATIGALVDSARQVIGDILGALADPVIEQVVPALNGLVAAVKATMQGLRQLLHGQPGADWPTTPSGTPLPQNLPHGPPEIAGPKDQESKIRGLRLQNEAARTLARAGYDVEQLPRRQVPTPDYLIEGKRFDCYAPTAPSARNIWQRVKRDKIERDQTDRVVINIDAPDVQVDVDDLRRQFQDHPIPGLVEAKVIAPGGAIIDIYP